MIRKIINKINSYWCFLPFVGRYSVNRKNRKRLTNHDFTIISSNCNGGIMYHDLGLRFDTPFINLYLLPDDYLKMLSSLDYYLNLDLIEDKTSNKPFPVGILGDIHIYFQHYNNFNEAYNLWKKRSTRIHKNNLFIIFSDRDGCTKEQIKKFDQLPYKNKVCFVHDLNDLDSVDSAYLIKGFETECQVGVLSDFKYPKLQIRYLDQFDYVKWLNKEL